MAQGKRKTPTAGERSNSRWRKKGNRPPRTRKEKLKRLGLWSLITFVVLSVLGAGGFYVVYSAVDIPDPNEQFLTQTTQVYYAGGKAELGQFAVQERDSIDYEEMPQYVKDAVVAAENQSFWTDNGIDPKGIIRAAFNNASGNSTQGASTITQQYVKVLYLTQERTWKRKIKEAILSLKIKNRLSKQKILEGYLNTIYFGRGAYGIQAAAQTYFGRDAKDLDLRQSVSLAAILNNPSLYDPANGEEAVERLEGRYQRILDNMVDMETVESGEAATAAEKLPKFPKIEQDEQYGGQKGHVLQMVRKELVRLGFSEDEINGGGLQVTTTFTRKAMDAARDGVREERPEGFGPNLHVAVASVEPGTGAVRGIFGGHDFLKSQLNWAVAGGQAGSTFKPFALAAAIESGFELKDRFAGNSPYELPDGSDVENQGDQDYGDQIDLINATENSVNTAYIDMTLAMPNGPQKVIQTANKMGVPPADPGNDPFGFPDRSPGLQPNTGVALGSQTVSPINMANGYATIANRGVAADAYIIEKVVDDEGVVRYDHKVTDHRAIREGVSDDVGYTLQQVVRSGSGTAALELGRPVGGKTGTATNGKGEVSSAWFVGYTPQLSTAVMYVRGTGTQQLQDWLPEYFGGAYPARTWTAVMQKAMEGLPVEELPDAAWVEGEAPDDGHEPYVPPPAPTREEEPKPKPKPKPKKTTQAPPPTTSAPSPEPEPEPKPEPKDSDGDGIPDSADPDDDNDGIPDSEEGQEPPPANGGGNGSGGTKGRRGRRRTAAAA